MKQNAVKTLSLIIILLLTEAFSLNANTELKIKTNQIDFISYASANINTVATEHKVENANEKADTNKISSELIPSESLNYSVNEFMIANSQRYLIDGSTALRATKLKPLEASVLGACLVGIFYVQHEMQQNTIWKRVGKFHVLEDAKYSFYQDKLGHFYGTYMPSYVFGEALMESGFSWDMGTILGSAMGLMYTGYVEVLDGMSQDFGFSPSDFYADIAGASFYLAQHYFPVLQNFSPKFMYVNPVWHGQASRKPHETFIDDYSSQVLFISINVHNLLPENLKKYWPEWIDLSFGRAVYSLADPYVAGYKSDFDGIKRDNVEPYSYGNVRYIIALDYNLTKIIPDSWGFLNWFRQSLNYFKLPSPAIEFGKSSTKFYLLYPFQFNLGSLRF